MMGESRDIFPQRFLDKRESEVKNKNIPSTIKLLSFVSIPFFFSFFNFFVFDTHTPLRMEWRTIRSQTQASHFRKYHLGCRHFVLTRSRVCVCIYTYMQVRSWSPISRHYCGFDFVPIVSGKSFAVGPCASLGGECVSGGHSGLDLHHALRCILTQAEQRQWVKSYQRHYGCWIGLPRRVTPAYREVWVMFL